PGVRLPVRPQGQAVAGKHGGVPGGAAHAGRHGSPVRSAGRGRAGHQGGPGRGARPGRGEVNRFYLTDKGAGWADAAPALTDPPTPIEKFPGSPMLAVLLKFWPYVVLSQKQLPGSWAPMAFGCVTVSTQNDRPVPWPTGVTFSQYCPGSRCTGEAVRSAET